MPLYISYIESLRKYAGWCINNFTAGANRYLSTADGSPYYRAAMAQCDGDLAVVCPTKWLHQKLGQLGTEARIGFGRIVVSETEAPIILANLV